MAAAKQPYQPSAPSNWTRACKDLSSFAPFTICMMYTDAHEAQLTCCTCVFTCRVLDFDVAAAVKSHDGRKAQVKLLALFTSGYDTKRNRWDSDAFIDAIKVCRLVSRRRCYLR